RISLTSRAIVAVLVAIGSSPLESKVPAPPPSLPWISLPRPAVRKPSGTLVPDYPPRLSVSRLVLPANTVARDLRPRLRFREPLRLRPYRCLHPSKRFYRSCASEASS